MPLILPDFSKKISDTTKNAAKTAAEKAFYKAMTLDFPGGENFGEYQKRQAAIFADEFHKVFDSLFSNQVATHIDFYIKSASVVVPPGQLVTTAGGPTNQIGATTANSPQALIS